MRNSPSRRAWPRLIIAITPLWFLVLDSLLLGDHHISARGKAGLVLGIVGLFVLVWPQLQAGSHRTPRILGLDQPDRRIVHLGAGIGALQALAVRHGRVQRDRLAGHGGGSGKFRLRACSNGDLSHVHWTARGLSATMYLVVCGSWIGYTAYIWLLEHVPTSKVSTYAYVNPVVAVFLGWLILHERVDRFILAGSAIVVLSVILVTSAKVKEKTRRGRTARGGSGGRLEQRSDFRFQTQPQA